MYSTLNCVTVSRSQTHFCLAAVGFKYPYMWYTSNLKVCSKHAQSLLKARSKHAFLKRSIAALFERTLSAAQSPLRCRSNPAYIPLKPRSKVPLNIRCIWAAFERCLDSAQNTLKLRCVAHLNIWNAQTPLSLNANLLLTGTELPLKARLVKCKRSLSAAKSPLKVRSNYRSKSARNPLKVRLFLVWESLSPAVCCDWLKS